MYLLKVFSSPIPNENKFVAPFNSHHNIRSLARGLEIQSFHDTHCHEREGVRNHCGQRDHELVPQAARIRARYDVEVRNWTVHIQGMSHCCHFDHSSRSLARGLEMQSFPDTHRLGEGVRRHRGHHNHEFQDVQGMSHSCYHNAGWYIALLGLREQEERAHSGCNTRLGCAEQKTGYPANIGFLPSTLVLQYVLVEVEKTYTDGVHSLLCWQDIAGLHLHACRKVRTQMRSRVS